MYYEIPLRAEARVGQAKRLLAAVIISAGCQWAINPTTPVFVAGLAAVIRSSVTGRFRARVR